ncbi:MAG: 50S ribosomal protein L16 [Candidatus Aenigmatarchaeota archaeon]
MAKLRPWRCYRRIERPNTRQSVHVPKKGYVKGVPKPKIAQYEMGIKKEYDKKLFLVAKTPHQIRHNALESARMAIVKALEKKTKEYFIKLRIYPHHVFRENPLATGAGADRYQQGMRMSFGKPIGTSAQVKKEQKIFEVRINNEFVQFAKEALKKAGYKLPLKYKIILE